MDCLQRWGKAGSTPWHRLTYHGLDVAAVLDAAFEAWPGLLEALAAGLGLARDDTRRLLLMVLALHDLGKVSGAFQHLRPDLAEALGVKATVAPYDRRQAGHDTLGFVLWRTLWRDAKRGLGPAPAVRTEFSRVAALIAAATGHHGVQPPTTGPTLSQFSPWLTDADLEAAQVFHEEMRALFAPSGALPTQEACERLSYTLNGLFSVCDWLGSAEAFAYHAEPLDLADYYNTHAQPTARRLLADLAPTGMTPPAPAPLLDFAALFPGLASSPTPLQAACARHVDPAVLPEGALLVIVEDAPGAGKTEAGDLIIHRLLTAGRAWGFYAGLPTTATAESAFQRKKDVLERLFATIPSFMLAHGRRAHSEAFHAVASRAALETGEGDAQAWFTQGSKRALLSPAGVGTVDQALMGALRVRHGPVRLWGLWRKVLLVDEVHAYDDYMLGALEQLLRHHAAQGDPAILMSATLPTRLREQLVAAFADGAGWPNRAAPSTGSQAFPLLTLHHAQGRVETPVPLRQPARPVHLQAQHAEAPLEDAVVDWASQGRCVVWFRNTVHDARATAQALAPRLTEAGLPPPLLFHARYLPHDRARIERTVLALFGKDSTPADRAGRVLITTQVAEQSLDLDFDEWISDLAPADVVLQRLGRRRRHARDAQGARLPQGHADQRPDSPAFLLMPPLDDADHAGPQGWLARVLPRSQRLYPDDARLWLGARHLIDPTTIPGRPSTGPLKPEEDARPLLESVYAETNTLCANVPPALHPRHNQNEGKGVAERAQARHNTLAFRNGLLQDWQENGILGSSPDEEHPPTRLGDSAPVALATHRDTGPAFLGEDLDRSLLRVPQPLLPPATDQAFLDALAALLPLAQRRRLSFTPVLCLTPDPDNGWVGSGLYNGRPVQVRYACDEGLSWVFEKT
ncbi:CRISPR-associated helicase/endonuclease Cas3 [Pararhodospirillum photometricum]|uniref:CRISPR-associated helicase Cas3, putative n=1 Tax=Pararhodospirillum photometricum DSM 122 TaxID=1150469 RepID=H6SSP1_PARPM|nr:CRISPR-associated helicase/endonuclease Cas3 [Pararhodospirillum photometricum]CCG07920.1 CRISPR-associated helicase Cas3, putative [Pararhodospirillum photometricum DSM 122]